MNLNLFKTYLKISSRNLMRNKLFSFISIAGFTIGLTVFILILLFVLNELNYDSMHENKDRIFHALLRTPDFDKSYGKFPLMFSDRMKESFPQILASANCLDKKTEIKANGELAKEIVTFTDADFFRMFSFKTIAGNPHSFGSNPLSIFITQAFAEKYFGKSSPINKTVSVKIEKEFQDFLVTGIIDTPPDNSTLKFNLLIPFINAEKITMIKFSREDCSPGEYLPAHFVMLRNKEDKNIIESGFQKLAEPILKKGTNYHPALLLNPLSKVHMTTDIEMSSFITTDPLSVLILSMIGFVILIIVSINYINLTIAQSSHRFKEIGVRKVVGALRQDIAYQFLSESFFIVLISLLVSIMLALLILPIFNQITGKHLTFDLSWSSLIAGILLIPFILSLLAGAYPSLIMSGLNPVNILKGKQKLSGSKGMAKIFVTTQFILAIVLISGAVIMNSQYNFIVNSDLGYNTSNIILIRTNELFGRFINFTQLSIFKDEILKNPDVKFASSSDMILGGHDRMIGRSAFTCNNNLIPSYTINIDASALPALDIRLKEGRNFSYSFPTDSINSLIVNEEFVRQLGLKNPVGTNVMFLRKRNMQIVGVVKDFYYMPLREKILPAAFFLAKRKSWNECVYVKISSRNVQNTVRQIKKSWEKLIPGQTFDYVFLDNKISGLYSNENRWKNIITYTSVIAIFFACMGLFGLIFYSARKRTKEIGIRKVLGASTSSIVLSLINEFIILIAIAIILGCMISYYFADKWLANFAYHIELSFWLFFSVAVLVAIIVLSTILGIALKVASTDSVKNLRYE
ncbi:MAG: FtsX-like permease family protein [Ignavibacteriales bacterium]